MEMDFKRVEEIKEVIKRFQEEYDRKNVENIDGVVREFFIDEEDTSLVGTGVSDWNFGINKISDALKSYWLKDSEYLRNIELDIDNSIITVEGETAVAALSGNSMMKIDRQEMFDGLMLRLEKDLKKTDNEKLELMRVSHQIARALYEINLGEDFVWPFRATFFLINRDSKWMFKHINLSFGACNGWEKWFTDENINNEYKTIPVKSSEDNETAEIRRVLYRIQEGYDKRDIDILEDFSSEIFIRNENDYIFGTDEGENFKGETAGYTLSEGDWKYWGDFEINADNAYISVYGKMAFVYSKAFLRETLPPQETYNSLGDLFHNYLLPDEVSSENKIMTMLWKTTTRLFNAEHGGRYIAPMKFAGVLVKKDNKWRFQHMHFSDNIDEMPEPRIV